MIEKDNQISELVYKEYDNKVGSYEQINDYKKILQELTSDCSRSSKETDITKLKVSTVKKYLQNYYKCSGQENYVLVENKPKRTVFVALGPGISRLNKRFPTSHLLSVPGWKAEFGLAYYFAKTNYRIAVNPKISYRYNSFNETENFALLPPHGEIMDASFSLSQVKFNLNFIFNFLPKNSTPYITVGIGTGILIPHKNEIIYVSTFDNEVYTSKVFRDEKKAGLGTQLGVGWKFVNAGIEIRAEITDGVSVSNGGNFINSIYVLCGYQFAKLY